jgi:hypothetical protein
MLVSFAARESVVHDGMTRSRRSVASGWVRRLTPLAWLFVVVAGLDLVQRLLWLPAPPTLTTSLAGIVRAFSPALLILLPAAVLVGEPTAWRTGRLILIGALTLAGAELVALAWRISWESTAASAVAAAQRVPGEPLDDWVRLIVAVARLAGPILLAVGLSRLLRNRAAGPSARPTLGGLVAIALGVAVTGTQLLGVLGERGPLHRLEVVAGVFAALVAVAWACLVAVALPSASTNRSSRPGRIALASGALLFVAASALSIVNAAALDGRVELPSGFFVLSSLLSGVGAVLLIAGFATGLPSADAAATWAPESGGTLVEPSGAS